MVEQAIQKAIDKAAQYTPIDVNQVRIAADANRPTEVNEPKGPVDFNDPNGRGITSVLAVVANAVEYADDRQRHDLMTDPLVEQAIQKAIDKAAQLESEGRWLDAYARFGMWLKAIDPNNVGYKEYADGLAEKAVIAASVSGGYKDYAEGLLEKAMIASSFEDSPCETSQQRYEGVSQRIFSRALHIVGTRYVHAVDYGQMAMQAVKRCRQLAEVLAILPPSKASAGAAVSLTPPEPNAVKAWSSGLAALADQMKQSATGLNEKTFRGFFEKVLQLNQSTLKLPEGELIWHFVQASLESLDPHTVIVWPTEKTEFDKIITNEFAGIGVEISKPEGVLTIGGLLPDTPAYRAGLDAGEEIETVDGVPTKDMPLPCAVKKITGPKGTKVALTIRRSGEEKTREVTIVRDKIVVPTISGWQRTQEGKWRYLIDPNDRIGYVRISSFSKETASDFEKVLRDLEKEGLRGLILDLRWNQGGQLDVALRIVDMFIKEGVILRVRPGLYGGPAEGMRAEAEGTHPDYPMVILINEISASASEIVAGALADPKYKRAVLVGERTHGKGSVQSIEDRDLDGAEVKYTTAYYYLPSDQRVYSREEREKLGLKDWGVGPDVEVALRMDEVRAMVEAQRANDVLAQADRPATKEPIKRRTIQQFLEADPQLAIGLLVVKAELVQAGQPVQ
jgi:carboxyl-terminal processing protease